MHSADVVALAILAAATLRGLWLGLIRESFSIAALAGAYLAARLGAGPLGAAFLEATGVGWPASAVRVGAALLLAIGTIALVAVVGRWLRRGARAAGLGWADRLGGSVLGAAEGALVIALLLTGALLLVGSGHTSLAGSRTLAAYEALRDVSFSEHLAGRPEVRPPPVGSR